MLEVNPEVRETLKNEIISSGTHRPQDLIPAFFAVLEQVAPALAHRLEKPPPGALDDDEDPFWASDDAYFLLNEDLFNWLQVVAPEGFYFGSHPGDGACFGFWEIEEDA